ncbi:hypothetical protein D3C80_1886070 [compost metagenome]
MPATAEHGQAAGILGQAPEHHRRVERYRVEAIGGNADRRAIFGLGGDDGHARGEGTECGAKCLRIETGLQCHDWPHGLDLRAGSIPSAGGHGIVFMD